MTIRFTKAAQECIDETGIDFIYETPFGGFDTWEAAAIACERADMDPCDCIKYVGPAATPPALVHAETAYGQTTRLSFAIKCF